MMIEEIHKKFHKQYLENDDMELDTNEHIVSLHAKSNIENKKCGC